MPVLPLKTIDLPVKYRQPSGVSPTIRDSCENQLYSYGLVNTGKRETTKRRLLWLHFSYQSSFHGAFINPHLKDPRHWAGFHSADHETSPKDRQTLLHHGFGFQLIQLRFVTIQLQPCHDGLIHLRKRRKEVGEEGEEGEQKRGGQKRGREDEEKGGGGERRRTEENVMLGHQTRWLLFYEEKVLKTNSSKYLCIAISPFKTKYLLRPVSLPAWTSSRRSSTGTYVLTLNRSSHRAWSFLC